MPFAEKLRIATWNGKSSDLGRLADRHISMPRPSGQALAGEKMVDTPA
jgi:hypothetical protein